MGEPPRDAPAEPDDAWHTFVVLALSTNANGITITTAVPLADEMEAHAVAEAFVQHGVHAWLVTVGPGEEPTIEPYGA